MTVVTLQHVIVQGECRHVVAAHHVVVERDRGDDERRATRHAHNGTEHASLVVQAVVYDGLGEKRQLIPDRPFLEETRLAFGRLIPLQKLDCVFPQDGATCKPRGPQHERQF